MRFVDIHESSDEHVVLLIVIGETPNLNPIVLQVFQADGSVESFELQTGSNQLIPQATDKYRVSNTEGDLPPEQAGAQWAPTVWRDGDDLIIDSPKANTALTIKEYFAVCGELGQCPVEIAPAGASSVVVDTATMPLQTIADGRALLADFSPLAELPDASPGVGSYVLGTVGTVALLGLVSQALSDNEDSSAAEDDELPINQDDGTLQSIRVAGDNIDAIALEGDNNQIVSASEASSDENRFQIVLTLNDDVEQLADVKLYWDYQENKEYVELSADDFSDRVETADNTVVIDVRLDARDGPGGERIVLDDLVELDIVLIGDNPNNAEIPNSRIDIPLDIQIRQGDDASFGSTVSAGSALLPTDSILPPA